MKHPIFHLTAILLLTSCVFAADTDVIMHFPAGEVSQVLDFYERITGRKIWLATNAAGIVANEKVDLVIEEKVPREEAARLIRAALLESAGLEIRETDTEAFVTRSKEKEKSPVAKPSAKTAPEPMTPVAPPKIRVRVIKPKE